MAPSSTTPPTLEPSGYKEIPGSKMREYPDLKSSISTADEDRLIEGQNLVEKAVDCDAKLSPHFKDIRYSIQKCGKSRDTASSTLLVIGNRKVSKPLRSVLERLEITNHGVSMRGSWLKEWYRKASSRKFWSPSRPRSQESTTTHFQVIYYDRITATDQN